MKRYSIVLLFLLVTNVTISHAQSFAVDFLFAPSLTYGSDWIGNGKLNDSTNFSLLQHKAQLILPLKTKLGVDFKDFNFKKIDAKANQLFLNFDGEINQPAITYEDSLSTIYGFSAGITGIHTSIRQGVWIYGAHIYLSENNTTLNNSPMPNFKGYIMKVKLNKLPLIYFYGATLIVNQGKFIPFPLFGIRMSFLSKFSTTIIFPVKVKLKYKFNKKINVELGANWQGINTIYRAGSVLKDNDNTINYRQLRTYLGFTYQLSTSFKMRAVAGYSSLQEIRVLTSDVAQHIQAAPYIGLSLNYRFGKSLFHNFIGE